MRVPTWLLVVLVATGSFGLGMGVWALTAGSSDEAPPGVAPSPAPATASPSRAASTPTPTPSPPLVAPPTPAVTSPPAPAFALSVNAFGPVKLPAAADAALAAAKPRIGSPSSDEKRPGCELAGPNRVYRSVEWGDLRLAGDYEGSSPPMFSSWSVDGTNLPAGVTLPYGVAVGTSYASLKGAVTGYVVNDDHMFNEGLIITKGALWWFLDKENTVVTQIVANPLLCE